MKISPKLTIVIFVHIDFVAHAWNLEHLIGTHKAMVVQILLFNNRKEVSVVGVFIVALGFAIKTNCQLTTQLYVDTETKAIIGENTELNCLCELIPRLRLIGSHTCLLQQALRLVLLWANRRAMKPLELCQFGCVLNVLYERKEEGTEFLNRFQQMLQLFSVTMMLLMMNQKCQFLLGVVLQEISVLIAIVPLRFNITCIITMCILLHLMMPLPRRVQLALVLEISHQPSCLRVRPLMLYHLNLLMNLNLK